MINFEAGKIYQYYNTYTKKWHDMKLWEIVEPDRDIPALNTSYKQSCYIFSYIEDLNNRRMYFLEEHVKDENWFREEEPHLTAPEDPQPYCEKHDLWHNDDMCPACLIQNKLWLQEQISGELCDKCGWAMKFPNEPCRCELLEEIKKLKSEARCDNERNGNKHYCLHCEPWGL
jgi:Zn ribbon nucleic-acid-binding protein